jgi:glycosyltransferase involved in cell wall biosynthesis
LQQLKKLFIAIDWFTPAFKAGGPITSISNLVTLLKKDILIYVYTSNTDIGINGTLENITTNTWIDFDHNVKVYYADAFNQNKENIVQQITILNPDTIYLNSIFSKHYSIHFLQSRKKFKHIRYILAPRGMLKESALKFKPLKKKLFFIYAKFVNLYKDVYFQATDKTEVEDIGKVLKITKENIFPISNCPKQPKLHFAELNKEAGLLSIIFVGRIHKIKNLHFLLELLLQVKGAVTLTIVGNIEDATYLQQCETIIQQLPPTINVNIIGQIEPSKLEAIVLQNHILCLPTLGENFGHAIYETLSLGRPVIISDQTPWLNLQQFKAGFDIALHEPQKFINALQLYIDLTNEEFKEYCKGASALALNFYNNSSVKQQYLEIFKNS